jgi:hypothetical protein
MFRSEAAPRILLCSTCGGNPIERPPGAKLNTRFTCKQCVARLCRRKNVAECWALVAELASNAEWAKQRLARRRGAVSDHPNSQRPRPPVKVVVLSRPGVEVYRARDSKLGRDVALKILPENIHPRSRTHGAVPARSESSCFAESSQHLAKAVLPRTLRQATKAPGTTSSANCMLFAAVSWS